MYANTLAEATVPDPKACPPIRWGILGAGHIARTFAADARLTGASVVAIGSRSQAKAEAFAVENGIPAAVGSYDELVSRDDVDAVYVATPHSAHRDAAMLALNAGKPVLVEKAFARNAAEAREIQATARERGLFAMEAMWSRFLPHMVAARALIEAGAIGSVVEVVADHCQALTHVARLVEPELAGGALLDLGVYPISFIHSLLGTPDEVRTRGTRLATGVDATSTSALIYGSVVAVATTSLLAVSSNRAWVSGTEGYIEFGREFYRPESGGITLVRPGEEPLVYAPAVPGTGFQYEIAEASRCIDAGLTESPTFPVEASVQVMTVLDEVRRQLGVRYPGEPSLRPPHPGADV